MLKKLHRNCQLIFPVKFDQIDPLIIREKLFKLYDEGIAREDIAQLQLRIKGHFLDDDLETVVTLAADMFQTVPDQSIIDEFFKYKSHIFTAPLKELTAQMLLDNLAAYKEFKRKERIEFIEYLRTQIDTLYADEKLKEEKLTELQMGLVAELKRTSFIKLFADTLDQYMPATNELKHFNAARVSKAFLDANGFAL